MADSRKLGEFVETSNLSEVFLKFNMHGSCKVAKKVSQ